MNIDNLTDDQFHALLGIIFLAPVMLALLGGITAKLVSDYYNLKFRKMRSTDYVRKYLSEPPFQYPPGWIEFDQRHPE